jgi:hypothetical protein
MDPISREHTYAAGSSPRARNDQWLSRVSQLLGANRQKIFGPRQNCFACSHQTFANVPKNRSNSVKPSVGTILSLFTMGADYSVITQH